MNSSEAIARMSTAANLLPTKTTTNDCESWRKVPELGSPEVSSQLSEQCLTKHSISIASAIRLFITAIDKIKKVAPASESASSNQAWAFIPLHRVECRVEPPRRAVGGGTSRS
ncbi:hypothetical protein ACEPAF_2942 [Sanghuangporus sanghuang]